jgi:protoheme IX farnesyltransferase
MLRVAQPAQSTSLWYAPYVALMKPRVISLLLVTTLAGMFIAAADELPPAGLVFWTLVGGFLSAGGANAINCYLDRDIDELMSRTTRRPIPAGEIAPERALVFGIGLTVLATLVFAAFVNVLSAGLSLLAAAYYVFVYTRWLKRTTPSNIVIGGAAGALPPVIGWAAVRGDVTLLPIWLFVIVFYWTPPHFWALSLLIKTQYARAGVPMLPIVRGDEEARRQILWYTLLLVALTLLLVPFGMMGRVYLVSAVVLGGLFIWSAVRLRREATAAAARALYKFSLSYLALLFTAMVVDRHLPL